MTTDLTTRIAELTATIEAQQDKDEALARQAAQVAGPDWTWKTLVPEGYDYPTDYVTNMTGTPLLDTMGGIEGEAPHVARQDPASVLRHVTATRELAAFAFKNAQTIDGEWGCCHDADEIAAGQCNGTGAEAALELLGIIASQWEEHE